MKQLGTEKGWSRLTEPQWPATEQDGWDMTGVALRVLDAKGAYRSPGENGLTFMVAVPLGIPAGVVAAGAIWWLRQAPWQPATRGGWALIGGASGLALALACTVPPYLLTGGALERVFLIPAVAGAGCGALLAWLSSGDLGDRRP